MGSEWVGPVALTQLVCEQTRRSPEPEAGHGHTLLGLCVQRPSKENLGIVWEATGTSGCLLWTACRPGPGNGP